MMVKSNLDYERNEKCIDITKVCVFSHTFTRFQIEGLRKSLTSKLLSGGE